MFKKKILFIYMGICKFCEIEVCESWYGNWCEKCRKLKHIINLFKLDKVMSVLSTVLIVDEEKQKEKIKEELKTQLHIREYDLKKRRDEEK
jgi:thiol-disulfide isomerase/thioredoxin